MSDLDEIREFLQARGVESKCPRCGNDHWTLSNVPSPWAGLWAQMENGNYSLDSPIFTGAMLICNNCGYTSLHSKHIIDQWKRDGKPRR